MGGSDGERIQSVHDMIGRFTAELLGKMESWNDSLWDDPPELETSEMNVHRLTLTVPAVPGRIASPIRAVWLSVIFINNNHLTEFTMFVKQFSSGLGALFLGALFLGALVWLAETAPLAAEADDSRLLHQRTPDEVLSDLAAAIADGDFQAAVSNYASDAVIISDGGIDVGHEQIRSSLEFLDAVYDGTQPEVVQQVVVETPIPRTYMVRQLFTIDTECIIVPDGIATYVIRKGLIQSQTNHGFPVFQCF